jgi:hypothetical protein
MIRGRENPIGERETEAAATKIGDRDEGEAALEIRYSCANRTGERA